MFHVKDSNCFGSLEKKGEDLLYNLVFLGLEILNAIQRKDEFLWKICLNQVPWSTNVIGKFIFIASDPMKL